MPARHVATPASWFRALPAVLFFALATPGVVRAEVPVVHVQVVKTWPHDPQAFTEGLFYRDGFLYESTGLEGHSSIRKVRLETGAVVKKIDLPAQYFGEGI